MAIRPLIIIGLLILQHSSAFIPTFSNYPPAAITCLNNAAIDSGCNADSSTFYASNACLCSNGGGFVTLAAQCVGASAPGALSNTYSIMLSNCAASDTDLTVSLAAFLSAGEAVDATTTSVSIATSPVPTSPLTTSLSLQVLVQSTTSSQASSPTSSQSSSSTSSQSGGTGGGSSGKLDTSDTIALAAGVPATVFTIIGVFVACCRKRRS